jgi:hypothetical protein
MSIVPQAVPADPRWKARIYPGTLSRMSAVRADVRADLGTAVWAEFPIPSTGEALR